MSVSRRIIGLLLALGLGAGVSLAQDMPTSPVVRRSLVARPDAAAVTSTDLAGTPLLVGVMFFELPAALAARWGLDGRPAPDPTRTPLGREMGARLSAAEAVRFRQALAAEGCRTLGATCGVALDRSTLLLRNVSERRTEAGEEFEDFGVTLEATPILMADGTRADLEYKANLGRLEVPSAELAVRTTGRLPLRSIWAKGKATLACGETALIRCGVAPPATTRAAAADASVIMVLLRLERVPVPSAPPNARRPTE